MSEPSDREKAAIRALFARCMVREDMEALAGYVARVDRQLTEWEEAAERVGQIFDPLKRRTDVPTAAVSPASLVAMAQGASNANKTLRERCAVCGGNRDTCGHFVGAGAS